MPSFVGGAQAKDVSSLHLPSSSSCRPLTLKFVDVSYRVKVMNNSGNTIGRIFGCGSGDGAAPPVQERSILHGVSGMVSPSETLAILGPSGSGKSTLLNALAGRLQGDGLTGSVLANGQKLSKSILRWIGFVTQDDVLYPHLTVRETLIFCSLLRLPLSLSKQDKVTIAESVIAELGLTKCQNTIIGNAFIRGVSGGERKRVSIGHEMLINPSLLILDEPTSGLDSTAAHRLVTTMAALAHKGKTIVTSIHQPSSRVYQTFDKVLVLSEGRCLYYGKGSEAMSYFESIGFTPSFPMNPADFLLDLANGVYQVENTSEGEKPNMKQTLITSYNTLLAPRVKAACMETSTLLETKTRERLTCKTSLLMWCNQLSILLQRNLKERKHETFNGLRVFQVITAAMLAGLMWWHSDFRDIQDRLGLLFFISIFWGVFPSFNAVFAFPQERAIFLKERASGLYTLSSYFMARVIGDLPMELILPTIFLTIAYWMTELKPELGAFLLTLSVLLGYVLVSQGLGLTLGATIMDAKQASTVVTVTMLAFVLTGGFYVHKVPTCMAWIKYISATYYSYRLFINVQYGTGDKIWSLLGCSRHGTDKARCNFVEEDVVGQISPALSVGALLFMFVGYRLLAYLALRRIK